MAAPTDTKGTPLSAMLDAKNTRIRAEADMKLLQNRLSHLKVAEERARKKIAETKARTQEIVGLKKRNMDHQESKTAMAKEREVNVAATAKNVAQNRKSLARHVQSSRAEVDRRRKKDAETTRERRAAGAPLRGARAAARFPFPPQAPRTRRRARQKHVGGRRGEPAQERGRAPRAGRGATTEGAAAPRARAQAPGGARPAARFPFFRARAATPRASLSRYARKVEEETKRAVDAERLIQQMAVQEQQLIERLRSTQDLQRQAYEELQESLQM